MKAPERQESLLLQRLALTVAIFQAPLLTYAGIWIVWLLWRQIIILTGVMVDGGGDARQCQHQPDENSSGCQSHEPGTFSGLPGMNGSCEKSGEHPSGWSQRRREVRRREGDCKVIIGEARFGGLCEFFGLGWNQRQRAKIMNGPKQAKKTKRVKQAKMVALF